MRSLGVTRSQPAEMRLSSVTLPPEVTGPVSPKFQFSTMVYQYDQVKLFICINSLEDPKAARFSDLAQVSPPASTDFARGRRHPWYVVPPRLAGWRGAGDTVDLP